MLKKTLLFLSLAIIYTNPINAGKDFRSTTKRALTLEQLTKIQDARAKQALKAKEDATRKYAARKRTIAMNAARQNKPRN